MIPTRQWYLLSSSWDKSPLVVISVEANFHHHLSEVVYQNISSGVAISVIQSLHANLTTEWYEALLYWKLYSQPAAVSNLRRWLPSFKPGVLKSFLTAAPTILSRNIPDVMSLVNVVGRYQLPGMKSETALPVRTTFLHILYPNVVPIFDQMVLKAVGAWYEGSNQSTSVLRQYIPHAWALADRHAQQRSGFKETAVRLTDMALWLTRA